MALGSTYCKGLLLASLFATLLPFATANGQPIQVDFSSRTYGPDGPWYAINASIGDPPQFVDLFPGHLQTSFPLGHFDCAPGTLCPSRRGGYYHAGRSHSKRDISINIKTKIKDHNFDIGNGFFSPIGYNGTVHPVEDTMSLYSNGHELNGGHVGVESLSNAYRVTTTTNVSISMTLGFFGLGSPFAFGNIFDTNYPGSNFYKHLYDEGVIPSPSFALHVGSPALDIPPSFVIGGYDRSRLMGSVLSQNIALVSQFKTNIVDVGLDTEYGQNPFAPSAKSGLLMLNNGTISSLTTIFSFSNPYMFLPSSTCDAIAKHLPIKLNPQYGVYLWDTSDPLYNRVLTSASYLSFSLQPVISAYSPKEPLIIKIPIQALILRLDPPISHESIPYFPCSPVYTQPFVLGRAFLQAATLGVNWGVSTDPLDKDYGHWYLAQAPGPNVARPNIHAIHPGDKQIFSGGGTWKRSWQNYWGASNENPGSRGGGSGGSEGGGGSGGGTQTMGRGGKTIGGNSGGGDGNSKNRTHKPVTLPKNTITVGDLSSGAKAGIGVAVASFVLAVAAIIGFFTLRTRRHPGPVQEAKSASPTIPTPQHQSDPGFPNGDAQSFPLQNLSPHHFQHMPQSFPQSDAAAVHELPTTDAVMPTSPLQNTFTGDSSPMGDSTNTSTSPPGTATFYSPDGVVSPISPVNPMWRTAFARVASVTAGREQPPAYPSVRPSPPVEERAELEADRGAELEAPRAVEKSGFLVA